MKLAAAMLIPSGVPAWGTHPVWGTHPAWGIFRWWLPEHRRVVTSGDAGLFFRTNVFTGEIGLHQIF